MAFAPTGLGWLMILVVWIFMTFRFWQNFKISKDKISEFLFYFSLFLIIPFFLGIIGSLFFADNFLVNRWCLIVATFLVTMSFAFLGYLLFYIKFPQVSPKLIFSIITFLAIIELILQIFFFPPNPSVELGLFEKRKWGLHFLPAMLYLVTMISTLFPLGIIFFQKFFSSLPREERLKAFGFGSICFMGIFLNIFCTVAPNQLSQVVSYVFFAVILFFLTFLTQKPKPS